MNIACSAMSSVEIRYADAHPNAAAIMAGTLVLPSIPPFAGGLAGFAAGQVRAQQTSHRLSPASACQAEGDGRRAQRPTGRQSLIVVSW